MVDVRTEKEWIADGKPDGEKIGLKTYFLTIQFADGSFNENFINEFKKRESAWLNKGGKFILPFPKFKVIK